MKDAIKQNISVINLVSLIATAFAALLYLQANFVQASEFKSFVAQEWEDTNLKRKHT